MSTEISRISGPYRHRGKFRFRIRLGPGTYAWAPGGTTEATARALAEAYIEGRQAQLDFTVGGLVDAYLGHLRDMEQAESTVKGAAVKLRCLVEPIQDRLLTSITEHTAKQRYQAIVPKYSAASHRTSLKYVRMMWRWANDQGIVKGKPQLTTDEARRLLDCCLDHVDDDGAVAVLLALLLALRSSEITRRIVRDVDDDGRRLLVKKAKTRAGTRAPEIPEVLRPAILARTTGRGADALLLPYVARRSKSSAQWLAEQVRAYCDLAGVPRVCPHGLRGTMASIAYAAGGIPHLVSAALGHASTAVTEAHYAQRDSVLKGEQDRRLQNLGMSKKDDRFKP